MTKSHREQTSSRRYQALLTGVTLAAFAGIGIGAGAEAAPRARFLEGTTLRGGQLPRVVAAGELHTCAVRSDGTVQCWGFNSAGQLGDGTLTERSTPVTIAGITTAVAVTTGLEHSCALLVDGRIRCWGQNESGQLGDGTVTGRDEPVAVSGITTAVAVSAGYNHTCALLTTGRVRCWGENGNGQLGDGTIGNKRFSVQVQNLTNVAEVAAGAHHTCALLADGSMQCWGANESGQLGNGTTTQRLTPVAVSGLGGVVAIAANAHTCAVLADGSARCWGPNTDGQLGDGTTTNRVVPTAVSGLAANVLTIAAGDFHTCAALVDGSARCWGNGPLGDTTIGFSPLPVLVVGLTNAVAVSAGGQHTCAAVGDGGLVCWGGGTALGAGNITASPVPVRVSNIAGTISARQGTTSSFTSCAARADGTAACWGAADLVGAGPSGEEFLPPTPVSGLTNTVAVAGGQEHNCARRSDGRVRCWGHNISGVLGDGTTTERLTPVPVSGLGPNAAALATGLRTTCVLRGTGTVQCWGDNFFGQLGDGTTTNRHTPVEVGGLSAVAAIAVGYSHVCALRADGTVRCWGSNGLGQLGDGTTTDRHTPVAVSGLDRVVALAAGNGHNCALRTDATLLCWGANNRGQLGDGTNTTRLTPVVGAAGLLNKVAVMGGFEHTCALRVDGAVGCWGANDEGQLGNGTRTTRTTPSLVSPLSSIAALAGGEEIHNCAIRVDGAPFCWGTNFAGQLGDGTETDRLRPVEVPSFRANVDPAADLASNGHRVLLTALVNCLVDHKVTIEMTLVQGAVVGQGRAKGKCQGRLAEYPLQVSVRQGAPFAPGPAVADLTATVRDGHKVVDAQEWTRAVQLADTPSGDADPAGRPAPVIGASFPD